MTSTNGIPADDVYWFDASRQTKRISANVTGLLGTTRISLNDNLMNRSPAESVQAVLGHEMGHYALNHVYKMLLAFGVACALVEAGRSGEGQVIDAAMVDGSISLMAMIMGRVATGHWRELI